MRVFVEIVAGPYSGKEIQIEAGGSCLVGRTAKADIILADDRELSPLHFALACDTETCHLYDMQSRGGTFHNGERVLQAALHCGDKVHAGQTSFVVFVERLPLYADRDTAAAGPLGELLRVMRGQSEPLFALVDAARDPAVLQLLGACGEEYQSLYDGESAEELAEVAPYLVSVPAASPFLETLLHEGWGKSWGVFLTSGEPFQRVRKHFRSLLYVEDDAGKRLYFRFYDPRVLRAFLPACDGEYLEGVFGPVGHYILEDEAAHSALRFGAAFGALNLERLPLVRLGDRRPQPERNGEA